jgi:hypothetical protein
MVLVRFVEIVDRFFGFPLCDKMPKIALMKTDQVNEVHFWQKVEAFQSSM